MSDGERIDRSAGAAAGGHAEVCSLCRQVFDRRDLAQVFWHAQAEHGPLLDPDAAAEALARAIDEAEA